MASAWQVLDEREMIIVGKRLFHAGEFGSLDFVPLFRQEDQRRWLVRVWRLTLVVTILLGLLILPAGTVYAARPLTSSLSGLVVNQQGKGVGNTRVTVLARDYSNSLSNPEWASLVAETRTDKSGKYKVSLPAGTYRVFFEPEDRQKYAIEAYPDAPVIDLGDSVTVVYGKETKNISIVLDPSGWIQGYVTDATSGDPLAGIRVEAAVQCSTYISTAGSTYSDGNGFYRIYGFKPYPFFVWANSDAGNDVYLDLMLGFNEWVPLPPAYKTVDLNIQRADVVNICGQVVDALDNPIAGIIIWPWLLVTDQYYEQSWQVFSEWAVWTDEQGRFNLYNLQEGTYVLSTDGWVEGAGYSYSWEFYDNSTDAWNGVRIEVIRGQTTEIPFVWHLNAVE